MVLQVVEYLRNGGTLAALAEQKGISARRHGRYPNLVLLKYSQINSPMAERIVQECRGLILDEADNWQPVSVPYFKFFNYGEGHAAPIDWPSARVLEKLDGSLMTVYHYRGAWRVSSSGLPDAEGPTGFGFTFGELFWRTWAELGYPFPTDVNACYMFEMMTPFNRVIVPHQKSRIVLHGVRRLDTLQELELNGWPWETVKTYSLGTMTDVLASCSAINPLECEGYVVVDQHFNRIKVKSPQYVALAHIKDSMSARNMLELIRANESDEFLNYFPEFRGLYEDLREKFDGLCRGLDEAYLGIGGIADQKAFAAEAVKTRCSSALFAIRKGTCKTAREYFAGCTMPALERTLGIDCSTYAIDARMSTTE